MIKAGIIGLGFMARAHFNRLQARAGIKVTALCDIDPEKLAGGWLEVEGNIDTGKSGEVDLSEFEMYENGLELIEKAGVDLVVVTTPGYLHRKHAVAALEAGKDVICEKPIATTLEDADAMVDAAQASGKLLLIGQCIRFWPDWAAAREIIHTKAYGRVTSATFRRIGGAPVWAWENWYMDGRRSGGAILDLHVHDVDYIHNVFGVPKEVSSVGTIDAVCHDGGIDHVITNYIYPDGPVITAHGGWYIGTAFPFSMSFVINLERATLQYNTDTQTPLTIYLPDGTNQRPAIPPGDGYSCEFEYFIECVMKRLEPKRMPPIEARNSVAIALAERESVLTGRPTAVVPRR
ncbi:Gfo/Idh/MocA family oxidoreductase [bacterium]|nr:Gfo/Idh/MocA family oxidoreductase [bacterium]